MDKYISTANTSNVSFTGNLRVSPNPFSEYINVELVSGKIEEVLISDCLGNELFKLRPSILQSKIELPTMEIGEGVFFCKSI